MNEGWIEGHALGPRFEEARMTETLLGAAMRRNDVMDELMSCGFGEDDLDVSLHRLIWRTALALHNEGVPPEPAIVEAKLIAGGGDEQMVREFIGSCLRGGVEVAHPRLAAFVQYVRNKVAMRRLSQLGRKLAEEAGVGSIRTPSQIAGYVSAEVERIVIGAATADGADGNDLVSIVERLRTKSTGRVKAYPTGHPEVDSLHRGGLHDGSILLVSAPIGIGKSTTARYFVRQFAGVLGLPTAYFSFEMNREEIAPKLQQLESGVEIEGDGDRELDAREHSLVIEATKRISAWPVHVEDRQHVVVEDVTSRIHQYVKRHGVKAVVIDYVQDIEFSTRHPTPEMNFRHISKTLRRCAKDLGIVMVQMAQEKGDDSGGGPKPRRAADDVVADTRQFMKDCDLHISLKGFRADERIRNLTRWTVSKNRRYGKLGQTHVLYDTKTGMLYPANERGERIRHPDVTVQVMEPEDDLER